MITYRGNSLVRGKVFTLEDERFINKSLKFLKPTKEGYVFTCEGEQVILNNKEIKSLQEKQWSKKAPSIKG